MTAEGCWLRSLTGRQSWVEGLGPPPPSWLADETSYLFSFNRNSWAVANDHPHSHLGLQTIQTQDMPRDQLQPSTSAYRHPSPPPATSAKDSRPLRATGAVEQMLSWQAADCLDALARLALVLGLKPQSATPGVMAAVAAHLVSEKQAAVVEAVSLAAFGCSSLARSTYSQAANQALPQVGSVAAQQQSRLTRGFSCRSPCSMSSTAWRFRWRTRQPPPAPHWTACSR